MSFGVVRSQTARNQRLAARPRCGHEWPETGHRCGEACVTCHVHRCRSYRDHAGRDHICECGARTQRKRASK